MLRHASIPFDFPMFGFGGISEYGWSHDESDAMLMFIFTPYTYMYDCMYDCMYVCIFTPTYVPFHLLIYIFIVLVISSFSEIYVLSFWLFL